MDMSIQAGNLASIQSAISTVMLDKTMNADAATMGALLVDFQEANVQTAPPSAGLLDIRV